MPKPTQTPGLEFAHKQIAEISKSYFVDQAPANVEVNAPRALIQTVGEGQIQGIRWMLRQPLVKAAPELLAMLYAVLPAVEEADEFNKLTHKNGPKVRALIAKVDGR